MLNEIDLVAKLALATFAALGVQKFILEPFFDARNIRRKYASALYIACEELKLHLTDMVMLIKDNNASTIEAMKKVPNNDFSNNIAWFTKVGYYTTITAFKVASVSAWLKIYQNSLLFSPYRKNKAFLKVLYKHSQELKLAFSTDTCLWFYYLDAVGERIIEEKGAQMSIMSFSKFCDNCANDKDFRLFFEQLHMYIWFLGHKEPKYLETLPKIQEILGKLVDSLNDKNLLSGFLVERPEIALGEMANAKQIGWFAKSEHP